MRVVLFGIGAMGKLIAQMLEEDGVELVGAVDPFHAGKSLEQLTGIPAYENVIVRDKAARIAELGAVVAIVTVGSSLELIAQVAEQCAELGLDVITLAEDAFDPFFSDDTLPLARHLDRVFKAADRTLVATGVQDVFLFDLPRALLGATRRVSALKLENWADLKTLGPVVSDSLPIGLDRSEAVRKLQEAEEARICFDAAVRPLLRALGAEIQSVHNELTCVIAQSTLDIPECGIHILAGTVRGVKETTRMLLAGSVTAEFSLVVAFLEEGEETFSRWDIKGEPDLSAQTKPFHGDAITCATLVNRLVLLAQAPSGFIDVNQLLAART